MVQLKDRKFPVARKRKLPPELEGLSPEQVMEQFPDTTRDDLVSLFPERAREISFLFRPDLRPVRLPEPIEAEFVSMQDVGIPAPQDISGLLERIFPERFDPEESFGLTPEEIPPMVLEQIDLQIAEDPNLFIETLRAKGRSDDTVLLLRLLGQGAAHPDGTLLTPEEIDEAIDEILPKTITFEWWKIPHWFDLFFQPYGGEDFRGKAASSFIAGIGDVVSTAGGTARWLGYEDAGKALTAIGAPLQRVAPPDTTGEFDVADLGNADWYLKLIRAAPFSLSLLPLALGGFTIGGGVAASLGLGIVWRAVFGGLTSAVLSRPAESALEAGSQYDDAIARGKTEKEAKEEADEVFRNNLALAGADAFEIAIALAPTPKWVPSSLLKQGLVRTARISGKVVIVGLSEGGEEMYQDMIQRHARGEEFKLDPISKEVFAIGFFMGAGMGLGGDVLSGVVSKAQDKMSVPLKKQFDDIKLRFKEDGFTDEQADLRALDEIMQTEEGDTVVREAVEEARIEAEETEVPIETPEEAELGKQRNELLTRESRGEEVGAEIAEIDRQLTELRGEPEVTPPVSPITDALITEGEQIVSKAEGIQPDNQAVKDFRAAVDKAKATTDLEIQRQALIEMEGLEAEVREIAGVPEVTPTEVAPPVTPTEVAPQVIPEVPTVEPEVAPPVEVPEGATKRVFERIQIEPAEPGVKEKLQSGWAPLLPSRYSQVIRRYN